jgi:PadR family transcriptional regulator PadR
MVTELYGSGRVLDCADRDQTCITVDVSSARMRDHVVREFLLAFWKVHILHHAEEHGVYGQWMLEELHHHGYRLSPGTLYPILTRMAERGWLRAAEPARATAARVYRLTPRGREVLNQVRHSLDELYREVGGVAGKTRSAGITTGKRKSTALRHSSKRRKRS